MTFTISEYAYDQTTNTYKSSGNTFSFVPSPASISKEVKAEWRIRHSGLRKDHKKAKWRYRKTEIYKISGILEYEARGNQAVANNCRQELEALATRNSKFTITTDMKSVATANPGDGLDALKVGSAYPPVDDSSKAYFVITDLNFTNPTGKVIIEYSMTLERVRL